MTSLMDGSSQRAHSSGRGGGEGRRGEGWREKTPSCRWAETEETESRSCRDEDRGYNRKQSGDMFVNDHWERVFRAETQVTP